MSQEFASHHILLGRIILHHSGITPYCYISHCFTSTWDLGKMEMHSSQHVQAQIFYINMTSFLFRIVNAWLIPTFYENEEGNCTKGHYTFKIFLSIIWIWTATKTHFWHEIAVSFFRSLKHSWWGLILAPAQWVWHPTFREVWFILVHETVLFGHFQVYK